ncbi:MAG: VWA domain-containing protein [Rhabdochlamydiaceae bacterium]|nr:VWA domain-containing protein [Rhabdochlamydiaceae bacterium]
MIIQRYLSNAYQTASQKYDEGAQWVNKSLAEAYSKLPQLDGFLDRPIDAAINTTTSLYGTGTAWMKSSYARLPSYVTKTMHAGLSLVWRYKKEIAGSIVVGGGLLYLCRLWINRPQKPLVEFQSSLHYAKLSIQAPQRAPMPPCATLVFCIDTSGSMKPDERSGAVKKALNDLVAHAEGIIGSSPDANISIEIVAFDENARVITPLTRLEGNGANRSIREQIEAIQCGGGTRILAGLEQATQDLIAARGLGSRTVILLTDGEDNQLNQKSLAAIHNRLIGANARLFAIGIGKEHSKNTLKAIVTHNSPGFSGTYIDTTDGPTIQRAIDEIYKNAIKPFSGMKIACSQLPAGAWRANRLTSVQGDNQSEVNAGSLEEGDEIKVQIRIDYQSLDQPVDLQDLTFRLTFTDPNGRAGEVLLHWNPSTIIDPAIVNARI